MNLDASLSILLTFCAACYLLLGLRLVASKRETGSLPIGVLFIVVSFWVMGGAIELMSITFELFSIGRTGHFVGTALLPVIAYVCFREYTGLETKYWAIAVLMIIPTLSVLLAASNADHQFMWSLPFANEAGEFLTRPDHWGPWFSFVHLPYSYAVIAAAKLTLIGHRSTVAPAQRRGLLLLVAAFIAPLGATVAYDIGIGSNTVSVVPMVFAAMLPVYAWLIFGEQISEFTPLAYEAVFQNMQDPVIVIDEQCRVIGLNHTAESLLDVEEKKVLLMPLEKLMGEDAPEVFDALNSGRPKKIMTSTGRYLHVQASNINSKRAFVRGGCVLMFRDVSDVERAQIEVRKSEKLLRTLIDHSVNGIIRLRWLCDDNGSRTLMSIFANSAAGKFLARDVNELGDYPANEIMELATSGMDKIAAVEILKQFERAVQGGHSLDVEVFQRHWGESRWLRIICEPVGDDFAMTVVDITESKVKEREMESIATSDPLTGVLNRRGFERDASLRLTESADEATGALLYVDLNDFKQINDEFGHEVGDQLLIIVSKRLRKSLRYFDIIGRPGGDEFVVLVPDVDDSTAEELATRVIESLEEPYQIGSEKLQCAASIGLALYPKNANTLTGLLREADQAMYRVKARCRGTAKLRACDLLEKAG
jgi:diguanylate cyclase (GGDEF)-like protein